MIENDKNYLESHLYEIDDVKYKLLFLSYGLEENGFIRKAKSLRTIVEKLEIWEHTKK